VTRSAERGGRGQVLPLAWFAFSHTRAGQSIVPARSGAVREHRGYIGAARTRPSAMAWDGGDRQRKAGKKGKDRGTGSGGRCAQRRLPG